jgi:hypothetical protein
MTRIVNDPEALKAWNKSQLAAAKAERRAGRV